MNWNYPKKSFLKLIQSFLLQLRELRSTMYNNIILQYNVINYDQDHIHPAINFRNKTLRDMGLSEQEITEWKEMKDQVPNLQMMDGISNKVKNKTPFGDWLQDKNSIWASDQMKGYLHKNYIPGKIEYGFANFNEFFNLRKKKLKKRLLAILVN